MNLEFTLQPKQWRVFEKLEKTTATWIGNGGGRGGAKSGGAQRIMLTRRLERPGTIGCIVMRNSDQVQRYHEDVMMRTWPELEPHYHKTARKIVIPFRHGPPSEIQFTYAESLQDVIRRFRSASYYDIIIDQAEQFTEAELREIKQAVRWPDVPMGTCKLLLLFNMGGASIGFLRQKFHFKEFSAREKPDDWAFVHVGPYDNVEWVRPALVSEGLTEKDFYSWGIEKRKEYCATKSDYGSALVSQDEALVKRDFEGSWESLEGAYFGRSFDRDRVVLEEPDVRKLVKPYWERWLSQDWGRGHFCVTYWHASGLMSPEDAKKILDWDIRYPIKTVVTYREYIAGGEANVSDSGGNRELDEEDIGRRIAELTPDGERDSMQDFFISPDATAKRTSDNTIAQKIGAIMTQHHMPYPRTADDDRVGGYTLMSSLLLSSKRRGAMGDDCWLISANCAELINSIPLAMRDPKNLDDVIKTDKSTAKIDQDCTESARYGLKSKLEPGPKPKEQIVADEIKKLAEEGLDEHSLTIHAWRMQHDLAEEDGDGDLQLGRRHGGRIIRR